MASGALPSTGDGPALSRPREEQAAIDLFYACRNGDPTAHPGQFVYVHALNGGRYYIGASETAGIARVASYFDSSRQHSLPEWVRRHMEGRATVENMLVELKPVAIRGGNEFEEELLTTLEYFLQYGLEKVRGSAWTDPNAQPEFLHLAWPIFAGLPELAGRQTLPENLMRWSWIKARLENRRAQEPSLSPGEIRALHIFVHAGDLAVANACYRCEQAGHKATSCTRETGLEGATEPLFLPRNGAFVDRSLSLNPRLN